MATRPTDYVNLSQLCVTVAANWLQFYPTYVVNFSSLADFTALAQDFFDKANQNANQDISKKDNSATLKALTKEIRTSLPRLKEYIRDEYSTNTDAMYAAYGLELVTNRMAFPTDNDRLMQRLSILLLKLQEPNNPLASRNKGLAYWENLITQHATEWTTAKNMKSQKAQLSQDCKNLKKDAEQKLSKLYRQIAIDNDRSQVASVRRSFGFLNETYK